MTIQEAILIHKMRVISGYTWRKIAKVWAEMYDEGDNSQHKGRELCEEAAKILGIEVD